MSKKIGVIVLALMVLTLSACTRSESTSPAATPTKADNFPQPLASPTIGGMNLVEIAASQTAAAQALASFDVTTATAGTPALVISDVTATATPLAGFVINTATATSQPGVDTAMPSPTTNPLLVATNTTAPGPTVQTSRPATYTLKEGEFVYCLARRFNVDPAAINTLNGLVDSQILMPGTTLKIPASGSFPGPRALKAHPATYTVQVNDTIYGIACLYGDVDPINIAAVNGLAAPYNLTVGTQLQIP